MTITSEQPRDRIPAPARRPRSLRRSGAAVPATAVAILAFNHATRTLGPANGVLFINLVPITAFAIEAVRGHRPTTAELAGVAPTLAAVIANNVYGRRAAGRARAADTRKTLTTAA
ncbi:hypothetical protein ACLQ2N_35000 [Streptomyces sp. DT224]|uniref:hypothetical protein n=1 Tax=Streptomyces sp. DT224 TaxID=3393426 RepID=UPI003CF3CFBE